MSATSTVGFTLPPHSEAAAPPERRGLERDGVRLLVSRPEGVAHRRFRELPELLEGGDLVVINTSRTLPAAVDIVRGDGRRVPLHVSTWLDDGDWVVEVRRPDGRGPSRDVRPGETLTLPGGQHLRLRAPYPDKSTDQPRLWRGAPAPTTSVPEYLHRYGRPIRYGYVDVEWPLDDLQTVYAERVGGAEMPSAGRPFTPELLVRLIARDVLVSPIVLHAGVSSPEAHEPPMPERVDVPDVTARLVNSTRAAGGRVIAVGTTVTRALESAADRQGSVHPVRGWTDLVLGPDRPARVVNGLVTGLHAPQASHLWLLEAVAGSELVTRAYDEAVRRRYLWHEFGDSMLFLPPFSPPAGNSLARATLVPR